MVGKTLLCAACGFAWIGAAAAQDNPSAADKDTHLPAGRSQFVDPKADQPLDQASGSMFQPKGIEVGSFLLLPKVEAEEGWNNNVYATQDNTKADSYTEVRPEMALRSRFDKHAVNLSASADSLNFARFTSDSHTDGAINADGRYDVTDSAELNAALSGAMAHEERGSPDDARGTKPTPTQTVTARVGGADRIGSFSTSASFEAANLQFGNVNSSNGAVINNADRNRDEYIGTLKGGYEFVTNYSAELEGTGSSRHYNVSQDSNGYQRDNSGYNIKGGLGVEINDLIRGEMLVGYFRQHYNDPRFSDAQGPSARAVLNWTPTRLLLVVPSFERAAQETTTAGASSMARSTAGVMVRWEYLPDVLITNNSVVNYDQFEGLANNNAVTYEEHLRVMYAFTQQFQAGAHVDFTYKTGQEYALTYNQTIVGLIGSIQF